MRPPRFRPLWAPHRPCSVITSTAAAVGFCRRPNADNQYPRGMGQVLINVVQTSCGPLSAGPLPLAVIDYPNASAIASNTCAISAMPHRSRSPGSSLTLAGAPPVHGGSVVKPPFAPRLHPSTEPGRHPTKGQRQRPGLHPRARSLFGLRPASQGLEVARVSDRGPVDLDPRVSGDVARVGPADGEPQPGPAGPDDVRRR